jgi:hypothetical protein
MAQANHVTNAIRVLNTAAGRKKSTNSVRTAFREPTAGLAGFLSAQIPLLQSFTKARRTLPAGLISGKATASICNLALDATNLQLAEGPLAGWRVA